MCFLEVAGDCSNRAFSCAGCAAAAFIRLDFIGEERFADTRRALLVNNMSLIFVAEEFECCENRIRSCLSKTAE